jgi:hypothetical protein
MRGRHGPRAGHGFLSAFAGPKELTDSDRLRGILRGQKWTEDERRGCGLDVLRRCGAAMAKALREGGVGGRLVRHVVSIAPT